MLLLYGISIKNIILLLVKINIITLIQYYYHSFRICYSYKQITIVFAFKNNPRQRWRIGRVPYVRQKYFLHRPSHL